VKEETLIKNVFHWFVHGRRMKNKRRRRRGRRRRKKYTKLGDLLIKCSKFDVEDGECYY
jgi:hypothetical protein